jgi:hypothetical protein
MAGTTGIARAQDALQVSPGNYHLEKENQWVRVLRLKMGPHERVPPHLQPETVLVYLSDAHQRLTDASGRMRELQQKYGDVIDLPPARQSEENLSDEPLEVVVIELKPGRMNSEPVKLDPVKIDPEDHIVVLENDRVRAIKTILRPHIKSPVHDHPSYVVVYLTVLHTTMKMEDGRVLDNPRHPGEVDWRDALQHQTENIGDQVAMEIQVEMK